MFCRSELRLAACPSRLRREALRTGPHSTSRPAAGDRSRKCGHRRMRYRLQHRGPRSLSRHRWQLDRPRSCRNQIPIRRRIDQLRLRKQLECPERHRCHPALQGLAPRMRLRRHPECRYHQRCCCRPGRSKNPSSPRRCCPESRSHDRMPGPDQCRPIQRRSTHHRS